MPMGVHRNYQIIEEVQSLIPKKLALPDSLMISIPKAIDSGWKVGVK